MGFCYLLFDYAEQVRIVSRTRLYDWRNAMDGLDAVRQDLWQAWCPATNSQLCYFISTILPVPVCIFDADRAMT